MNLREEPPTGICDLPDDVIGKICQYLVSYTPVQEIRPYGFHIKHILRLRGTCRFMYDACNNANLLLWISLHRKTSPCDHFLTMVKERTNWEISQLFIDFNVNSDGILGGTSAQNFFNNFECLLSKRHLRRVRFLMSDRKGCPHLRESLSEFVARVRSWPIHHAEMFYLKYKPEFDANIFNLFDSNRVIELSLRAIPTKMVGLQFEHMQSLTCLELLHYDIEIDHLCKLHTLKFLTIGALIFNEVYPSLQTLQELYVSKQTRGTTYKFNIFLQKCTPALKFLMLFFECLEQTVKISCLPKLCTAYKTFGWAYEQFSFNCDNVKCLIGSVTLKRRSNWNLPSGLVALNVVPVLKDFDYEEVDTIMRFILESLPFLEFLEIQRWGSTNLFHPDGRKLKTWISNNKPYLDSLRIMLIKFQGGRKKESTVYAKPNFEFSEEARRFIDEDFVICFRSEWYGKRGYDNFFDTDHKLF